MWRKPFTGNLSACKHYWQKSMKHITFTYASMDTCTDMDLYIPCRAFQYLNSMPECALVHFLPLVQSFTEHCSIILAGGSFRTRQRVDLAKLYTAFTFPTNWCFCGLKQCSHNNRNAQLYSMKQAAHTCPTRQSMLSFTSIAQSKITTINNNYCVHS